MKERKTFSQCSRLKLKKSKTCVFFAATEPHLRRKPSRLCAKSSSSTLAGALRWLRPASPSNQKTWQLARVDEEDFLAQNTCKTYVLVVLQFGEPAEQQNKAKHARFAKFPQEQQHTSLNQLEYHAKMLNQVFKVRVVILSHATLMHPPSFVRKSNPYLFGNPYLPQHKFTLHRRQSSRDGHAALKKLRTRAFPNIMDDARSMHGKQTPLPHPATNSAMSRTFKGCPNKYKHCVSDKFRRKLFNLL